MILVFSILVALLVPAVKGALASSRMAACLGNLKVIGGAAHSYASENNGMLPGMLSTAASGGQPANDHGGQQWDVQIMPYLGLSSIAPTSELKTPFFCPASVRNKDYPLSRQLSYAWNARITDNAPYNSKRLGNLQQPSTIMLAVDNKLLSSGPDKNGVTFGSAGNTIYVTDNLNTLKRVAYDRHNGSVNVLFADGSVFRRLPVRLPDNYTPQEVRFYSNGPLSK